MVLKRNIIYFIVLFLFASGNLSAQILKQFGIKSGISNAWQTIILDNDKIHYSKTNIGLNFGIYAEWIDIPHFGVSTEVDYIMKGMKDYIGINKSIKEEFKLSYLSILLLPKLYTEINNLKLIVFAGPRLDISLSKSVTVIGDNYMEKILRERLEDYENIQFGVTLGIGLEIKNLFPFIIGLESRYSPDLSKVYDVPLYYIKNSSLEILIKVGI